MLDQNQIDLFIAPRFLHFAVAMCIDTVRLCNREQPNAPLQIRLCSEKGGPVAASNAISLHTEMIDAQDRAATVIVLTSYEPEAASTPPVLNWIRRQHRQGARMACVETAAYLFARAKLLQLNDQNPASKLAAHFEAAPGYREMFGDQIALESLYRHDANIYSSAGAMSTLDLMLYLIEELRSKALADRIAYVFNHQRISPSTRKPASVEGAIAHLDTRLSRMVGLMQASINKPVPLATIFQQAGVEASTGRRLFKRILKQGPQQYYQHLRLQHGKDILQNSGLKIAQVAEITGFADGSSFSRAYKRVFGKNPGQDK